MSARGVVRQERATLETPRALAGGAANDPGVKPRRWIFWLLVPTLALTVFAALDNPADESAVDGGTEGSPRMARRESTTGNPSAVVTSAPASAEKPHRIEKLELPSVSVATASPAVDLLAPRNWHVEPPAQVASAPVPTAPPLPFKFVGRILDDADPVVFLASGDRNLVVRPGLKLASSYVVERISDTEITFIYLPLKQRQTLSLGVTN